MGDQNIAPPPEDPTQAAIDKAADALTKLSLLQIAAMKAGNLAALNALQSDCNDLTSSLAQLRALQVALKDEQIKSLNKQLDAIAASAQNGLDDLANLTAVLTNILTATKVIDGIIALVPR